MTQVKPGISFDKPLTRSLPFHLLNQLPIAIYTCDSEGYIVAYNDAAVTLWGRRPEIGKELWSGSWKTFRADGSPMLLSDSPIAQALKEGIAIDGEEIIIERPDGTRSYVKPYPVPIFDDTGVLTGAINTLIDITEQKKGEPKQAMLAAIIESSDDAIISKTLNGVITSWNIAAENMYGYTEQEAINKHISLIIPDDRQDEEIHIISKIKNGEKVDHFETFRKDKWGNLIPVSLTISPIRDSAGNILGASKIARDISKYKSAEEKLKKYADNLEVLNTIGKDVFDSLDVDDILQKVTDATTKLTGAAFGAFFYNKTDELGESYMLYTLSGAPAEAFEKFGMPRNTAVFGPTFAGQGIVRSDDITKDPRYGKSAPHLGMPAGHLPVISYLAVPVVSKEGVVLGGLFYGHPSPGKFTREHENLVSGVVNQTGVALENARLYEEIKKLNAKKGEFIGIASHELKTPVTSLKGYLQIFEKNLQPEDRNKIFIQKAVLQVNKLSAIISDLLDVSKIETGELPLSFSTFDLKQLVLEVIELVQYTSRTHQINFTGANELIIKADRQRIEQVIINLLSNAIKYSPNAKVVNITLYKKDGKAIVEVQDFGFGIKKELQPRIFSRFYRVEELASHISGLGIGLYLSKEIILRHKGLLNVISKPGKGSTFSFELPL